MAKSNAPRPGGKAEKPRKPYPDYPLFPHATGRWAKKIRGRLHYFGPWRDPQAAVDRYLRERDDLHAGRTPRAPGDGLTVGDLCNRFLTAKRALVDGGELKLATFNDYFRSAKLLVGAFGKNRLVDDLAADDFEAFRRQLAKGRGAVALRNQIIRCRVVFKYAYDAGLIERPVRMGQSFRRPSAKTLRLSKAAAGPRLFEPAELRAIIKEAKQPLRAMILLGINCGLGQTDVSNLTWSALDLARGWLDYPRAKTGVPRRAPLWPETIDALREVLADRGTIDDPSAPVFLTRYGRRFVRVTEKGTTVDGVAQEMAKLLRTLGVKRPRLNFYALRHSFATMAGEAGDQIATNHIMGHVDPSMAAVYRERIADGRLKKVSDYVRRAVYEKKR